VRGRLAVLALAGVLACTGEPARPAVQYLPMAGGGRLPFSAAARVGSMLYLDDVIRCTVMMADMKEWGDMNQVYAGFFSKHRPARSAFGATGLALGARVEIECIAVVPPA
jgi:hypothetical protein